MEQTTFRISDKQRALARSLRTASILIFLASVAALKGWSSTPIILSTDIGNEIDDQWAVVYMLTNADFEVLGIVSAHAPSLPDPSAHSSYLILKDEIEVELGMSTHPPLFEGASVPLDNSSTPRVNGGVRFIIDSSKSFSSDHRLTVLVIGAATDVASAILVDPGISDRIRIIAMAFPSSEGGDEYNVANDVVAWQVLLNSQVPMVIGAGDVCRADLALHFDEAKSLISDNGPVGAWLWDEYRLWYYRQVKPPRHDDFTKPWMIWDIITLAYLEGMTTQKTVPRPHLNSDMSFGNADTKQTVTWITHVDSKRLWPDFVEKLDAYQRTHSIRYDASSLAR
jgi:inosine-uridine nucleoside N-ribohydrolase